MKITHILLLLTLTLFVCYLNQSAVKAEAKKLRKSGPFANNGFRKLSKAGPFVNNVWNQDGHDSDATYRSNFNQTHAPWKTQLSNGPGSIEYIDFPLNKFKWRLFHCSFCQWSAKLSNSRQV